MDTLPITPIYGANTERRHQAFLVCVAGLAERHKCYLQDEGRRITDCYSLELGNLSSRIEIQQDVPSTLYEELLTCWKHCFS
ncbi:hypothetical protein MTX78_03750 [Hymenobacter tibetensis]|uniref:Uncharacterized protein n=1 Tax=Hymenobacter tibetensis TaxID=497967 RepID=A0ABY4D6U2_9BACT|nr:hypothetical protein [Hymenobacter tibetensis]UOG75713.1 hypothetical protein MTX78_03750 [Hymenobacter tibetensis]